MKLTYSLLLVVALLAPFASAQSSLIVTQSDSILAEILSMVYFYSNWIIFYVFCAAVWQNYFFDMPQTDTINLCLETAQSELSTATAPA